MATRTMERDPPAPPKSAKKATATTAAPRTYERPRGGEARAIADLMPTIGRTAFRRFGFVQSSVVSRWPEIVGETHARVCMPEMIRFPLGEKSEGIVSQFVRSCWSVTVDDGASDGRFEQGRRSHANQASHRSLGITCSRVDQHSAHSRVLVREVDPLP